MILFSGERLRANALVHTQKNVKTFIFTRDLLHRLMCSLLILL